MLDIHNSRKRKATISEFDASDNIFVNDVESVGSDPSDVIEANILKTFDIKERINDNCENNNHTNLLSIQKPHGFLCGMKLSDAVSFRHDKMIITTASAPFHIEWANAAWSRQCGWSCDEVLGLDFKFLQGSATDLSVVRSFLNILESSGGFANMTVLNYAKSHKPLKNTIHTFPLLDDCGVSTTPVVTHLAIILADSVEVHDPMIDELQRRECMNGTFQADRRVNSRKYALSGTIPPPNPSNWVSKVSTFSLSLMLRYMIRSQAAIVLTTLDGRIVHANSPWTWLTSYKVSDVEGVPFLNFIDPNSNTSAMQYIHNIFNGHSNLTNINSQTIVMIKCKGKAIEKPNFSNLCFQGYGPSHVTDCTYCKIHHENIENLNTTTTSLKYSSLAIVKIKSNHFAILITPSK